MEISNRVCDSRQFCSLCYFHFWRATRVFYLGRFEDVISEPQLTVPRPRSKLPEPETVVLLGDHYFVHFDASINSMAWQLLARPQVEDDWDGRRFRPPLEPEGTVSGKPVFPICRDCFWVTREFLIHRNSRTASRPVIKTLDALYAAIHAQWRRTDLGPKRDNQRWQLVWPHRSFRGPFVVYDRWERGARTTLYTEEPTNEAVDQWQWLVDNPYRPLPSLPDFLISHLKLVSTAENVEEASTSSLAHGPATSCQGSEHSNNSDIPEHPPESDTNETPSRPNTAVTQHVGIANGAPQENNFHRRGELAITNREQGFLQNGHLSNYKSTRMATLFCLPTEILHLVASTLDANAVFNLRLTCRWLATALPLDQHFWYRALMKNGLFGFFFDFDSMKVLEETRRKCIKRGRQPPHWDWKRLVGELARFESFQNGGVMDDAPGAFRNRRRIWRILEVAENMAKEENGADILGGWKESTHKRLELECGGTPWGA